MKVEPLLTYRRPKYPRREEGVPPTFLLASHKSKALIAAMLAFSLSLAGCGITAPAPPTQENPGGQGGEVVKPPDDPWAGVELGGVMPVRFLSEADIIQILQSEAAALGVSFESGQSTVTRYSGLDVVLDLYNEEKQVGVAVIDRHQANELTEIHGWDYVKDMYRSGMAEKGSLEDDKTADFFLTSTYLDEYSGADLRQAFRDFIEWLQSEGVI